MAELQITVWSWAQTKDSNTLNINSNSVQFEQFSLNSDRYELSINHV